MPVVNRASWAWHAAVVAAFVGVFLWVKLDDERKLREAEAEAAAAAERDGGAPQPARADPAPTPAPTPAPAPAAAAPPAEPPAEPAPEAAEESKAQPGPPEPDPALEARRALLREAFEIADKDHSGFWDTAELVSFGAYMASPWSMEYAQEAMREMDRDFDNRISFDEFLSYCDSHLNELPEETFEGLIERFKAAARMSSERDSYVHAVFHTVDAEHSGYIEEHEMLSFGRFMNPEFSDEQCRQLLDAMDADNSGVVSEAEFVGYFARLGANMTDSAFIRTMKHYLAYTPPSDDPSRPRGSSRGSRSGSADPVTLSESAEEPESCGPGENDENEPPATPPPPQASTETPPPVTPPPTTPSPERRSSQPYRSPG